MITLVNSDIMGNKNDTRISLTYKGFEHFLIQVAIFSHSKAVISDQLVIREMEKQARDQRIKRKKEAWTALGFKEENFKVDIADEEPEFIEDLRHMQPTESIKSFVKILRQQARVRQFNVTLFDDPNYALGDADIINELNKQLVDDNSIELPKGYVKRKEKKVEFVHHLPLNLPVEESFRVVYSTVDQILFDIFEFHIIEPIALQRVVTTAKP